MTGAPVPTPGGLFAAIPSPSRNVVHIGPVPLRAYALCILLGVLVAIVVARRRWVARGGEPRMVGDLAVWIVPGGLIGARLYHVATDYQLYSHDLLGVVRIWDGGLGIWGGVAGGALTGAWVARRWGLDFWAIADTVAPALPLAQAIGRWGNWFNQELFGRPTKLPWGLRIDLAHRPPGYADVSTFHPTFLYESLWNLVVVGIVLAVERRVPLRKGRLFAVYVAAYTFGRFWIELLRIDPAHRIYGLRVNDWTSVVVFVVALGFVVTARRRRAEREAVEEEPALQPEIVGEEREPGPAAVGAMAVGAPPAPAVPLGASDGADGGDGQDGHQVEERVGEDRGAQPAEAHGGAEDHAGSRDRDDDGDVGQAVDRVEVGESEQHGLGGDSPDRPEAVEERALDHAPEEELLDHRRADDGEHGGDEKAGGFWAEGPKDRVVGAGEPAGDQGDREDGDRDGHPGGEGHEQAPTDVAPADLQPEVRDQPAASEATADRPARPEEPGPQAGLADHQPFDPSQAESPPSEAEPDRGGHPGHEPDQRDQGGAGG
jgi:prolipoprotein diacylglyceryl transferase